MAKVKIQGHASGTGILTVTAPNTSTDRTITLPDATGTLLNSDGSAASLTSIPAANITGTLPAIDGSALTGIDLTSIRRDIATLALHSAIADNKAAFNLPNSFIDQFEDDTGLATQTDVDRATGEYVGSVITDPYRYWRMYKTNGASGGPWHDGMEVFSGATEVTVTSGMLSHSGLISWTAANFDNATAWFHTDSSGSGSWMKIDFGAGNEQAIDKWRLDLSASGVNATWNLQHSSNDASWTTKYTGWDVSGSGGWQEQTWTQNTLNNATGTLISTAQTANAAQTKVSGVILYKNNKGTATLGTDLKVYFTCNGGTNWTESTPAAAGTFSSGILMAKCPEVTCTSGTDVRYKAVWANQASGSKETQLHGIGMNY